MAKKYSTLFNDLKARLMELRYSMLPKKFSPTGVYSNRQLDRAVGYRLLTHSEIEYYLEERAWQTAIEAGRLWKFYRKITPAMIGLLAFSGIVMDNPPNEVSNKNGEIIDTSVRLDSAINSYKHKKGINHGVKEKNILQILYPIGFQPHDLDRSWLNTINSFGMRRGDSAHNSIRTLQPIDPKSEYDCVKVILSGIAEIDKKISTLI